MLFYVKNISEHGFSRFCFEHWIAFRHFCDTITLQIYFYTHNFDILKNPDQVFFSIFFPPGSNTLKTYTTGHR